MLKDINVIHKQYRNKMQRFQAENLFSNVLSLIDLYITHMYMIMHWSLWSLNYFKTSEFKIWYLQICV